MSGAARGEGAALLSGRRVPPRGLALRAFARAGSRLSRSEIREQRLRLTARAKAACRGEWGWGPTSYEEGAWGPRE